MKKLLSLIFSALFFTASISWAADNRALAKEVMDIHDEAMAKMTHMHELRLKLQDVEKTKGQTSETTSAIEDLKSAHKGMMDWMHNYKAPKTATEFAQGEEYLLQEKVKIEKVSDAINRSIQNAESLL